MNIREYYAFQCPDDDPETPGWFIELISEQFEESTDENLEEVISAYAVKFPFPIAETLKKAQEILAHMKNEDSNINYSIVKVTMQVESMTLNED